MKIYKKFRNTSIHSRNTSYHNYHKCHELHYTLISGYKPRLNSPQDSKKNQQKSVHLSPINPTSVILLKPKLFHPTTLKQPDLLNLSKPIITHNIAKTIVSPLFYLAKPSTYFIKPPNKPNQHYNSTTHPYLNNKYYDKLNSLLLMMTTALATKPQNPLKILTKKLSLK